MEEKKVVNELDVLKKGVATLIDIDMSLENKFLKLDGELEKNSETNQKQLEKLDEINEGIKKLTKAMYAFVEALSVVLEKGE